jgi:3-dehydroquinate synthase class II
MERSMPRLRILVADTSEALRAVVRHAVADQPDLVTIENGVGDVEFMLNAEDADVVVVGMAGEDFPAIAERLLDEYCNIGVVAIDTDRNHGVILRLRPQHVVISELSPPTLGAAIRMAATRLAALR